MQKGEDVKPTIIALVGPTAVGKTKASFALCRALDAEIVSMDSMQIYKGMDIGTAKPGAKEQAEIPHHLIDIVEPSEEFTVADYRARACAAIDDIHRRGKIPLLVGGTGLYLDALTKPMNMTPAAEDEALRRALNDIALTPEGKAQLHARLAAIDPQSAARLHENDVRRVIRAIEVYETTGKTLSEYHAQDAQAQGQGLYSALIYGLTLPRERLYARIDARVEDMLREGLLGEVQGLLARGALPTKDGAMQAIGYKELVLMLEGKVTQGDAVYEIKKNSRRYAKRQMTWFKRDARIRWFDVAQYDVQNALETALIAAVKEDLENEGAQKND